MLGLGCDDAFLFATHDEVKRGETTDVYFERTLKILKADGLDGIEVYMEATASSLPKGYPWAILGGLRDTVKLFEGLPVDIYALPEGSVFYGRDYYGYKEPILFIRGPYGSFAPLETPLLGFLAYGSGVATKAARIRKAAGKDALLLSFGARRMHPAVSPFISFYAYIGGCDGVSCILGAKKLGIKPSGTMPHSLIIIYTAVKGAQKEAWKAYDRVLPPEVPRIMLVDTFWDEVAETIEAVKAVGVGKIWGVRLDTPSSRRGSMEDIVREVAWKLKAKGYEGVKIFVSGGVDEDAIPGLVKAGVAGFGVGSAIANARTIDIALDITAIRMDGTWTPIAKRGKLSGVKQLYRCPSCLTDIVKLEEESVPKCPKCGCCMEPMLKPVVKQGKIIKDFFPSPDKERKYVLSQLEKLDLDRKPWE